VQGAGGAGGLLSVTQNSQSGSPTFFPTYDGNGNISEYLSTSGSVIAHFEYDPFGEVITSTGNTSAFDYRFSTKPQDAVTGWNYYGYRWYDAVAGRWASRDPIEEDGGVNLFGFLYNNTQNKIDILGLILECLNEEAKTDVEKVRNGSETGKKNVEQLEKSKNKHTVDTTSGGGSSNKPHDKKGLDDRKNGTGTGTHTRYDPAGLNGFSGESVLAHELQHAADSDNGTIDFGDKNKNGYPDAEDKAVDAENDHRKSGEDPDLRDDYGDQNPDPNKRDPEPEKKPTQGSGGQCPCKK
jgi:RHS repeat-associated protein